MCYQVPQFTVMMLHTCTEVIFTGKHIMNFLTHFMTPEVLHEVVSGVPTMKGDDSTKITHCRRQRLKAKAHVRFPTPHTTQSPLTCDSPQFIYL